MDRDALQAQLILNHGWIAAARLRKVYADYQSNVPFNHRQSVDLCSFLQAGHLLDAQRAQAIRAQAAANSGRFPIPGSMPATASPSSGRWVAPGSTAAPPPSSARLPAPPSSARLPAPPSSARLPAPRPPSSAPSSAPRSPSAFGAAGGGEPAAEV